ncbi:unnamed protein product [Notodromas monacha]|uniref:CHK kinase-like domain-containing protein n=1 Tax=Notodromas monacha TaxID=399045 RepID=A0A7R9GBK8_9CRUS|nr:unnamed protein product [Notodromas monacha]CAG0915097.1 unnamed protein product [Notodromas monacha]
MTDDWFEGILKATVDKTATVISVEIKPGLEIGENYGSSTFRIRIHYKTETDDGTGGEKVLHAFAKLPPTVESHRAFLDSHDIFEREAIVYNQLLPEMYKNSVAKNVPSPKVYFASGKGETQIILMEDLVARDFALGNRRTGFDLEETKCVLEAFASFHAHSFALRERSDNRDLLKFLVKPCDPWMLYDWSGRQNRNKTLSRSPVANNLRDFRHLGGTTEENDELIRRVEEYMKTDMRERIVSLMKPTKFSCFVLGDCWVNNMMIRYEEIDGVKVPREACLLDFQVTRFARPMMDLAYFWYTSTCREVFNNFDVVFEFYYEEFVKWLKLLGSQMGQTLTLSELLEEFEAVEEMGFNMSLFGLAVLMISREDFGEDYGQGGFAEDFPRLVENVLNGSNGKKKSPPRMWTAPLSSRPWDARQAGEKQQRTNAASEGCEAVKQGGCGVLVPNEFWLFPTAKNDLIGIAFEERNSLISAIKTAV